MDPTSPLAAIASLLVALGTALVIIHARGAPIAVGRNAAIDGLRGYLAFIVFLHHSCIWYFYLRTGLWQPPPSPLYAAFGQVGVLFFFMITAFLFFSKILRGREERIDWTLLFVSRVMRLSPLYLLAMCLLFVVIAIQSEWSMHEPPLRLLSGVLKWLGFTAFGAPDLNTIGMTFVVVAGVTWSLPYEWAFYLMLPALSLIIGVRPPFFYATCSVSVLFFLYFWQPQSKYLIAFLGGIFSAILNQYRPFRILAAHWGASLLIVILVTLASIGFASLGSPTSLALLIFAFSLISSGNGMFGILTSSLSRAFGEAAYGMYLLHGLLLFVGFNFGLGLSQSRAMSSTMHWVFILTLTPILVLASFMAVSYIELPAMRMTSYVTDRLRSATRRIWVRLSSRT